MIFAISIINSVMVGLFGGILSAAFCGAFSNKIDRVKVMTTICIMLLLQGVLTLLIPQELIGKLYPLIMHLPLVIVLAVLTKSKLWAFISVITAYLCCQLRRWLALLVVEILRGDDLLQCILEIILTVPLLILLMKYAAPAMLSARKRILKIQILLGVIPFLYYVFDYITTIYSDLLLSGSALAVEFMPFVCCLAYIAFLWYDLMEEEKRFRAKEIQKSLNLQIDQSVREITALRESQKKASLYRHDLRHHLQYIATCLEEEKISQAQEYIKNICQEVENQKVKFYCENETVNLILSAFEKRAEKLGIEMKFNICISSKLRITDIDLCVLLSNALENALHACEVIIHQSVSDSGKELDFSNINPLITVESVEKQQKLMIEIQNSYGGEISFAESVPMTKRKDHGFGVQSICSIVKKYQGISSFSAENGIFTLQIILPLQNLRKE